MVIYVGNVIAFGGGNVAVMADTTASLFFFIPDIQDAVQEVIKEKMNDGYIFETILGDFRDFPSRGDPEYDYPFDIKVPLTSDPDNVDNFILTQDGNGGDGPETIWSAIVDGVLAGGFSNGVIIIISDNNPLDPEPISNYTAASVASACLDVDAKVVGIAISGYTPLNNSAWEYVIDATNGYNIDIDRDRQELEEALRQIIDNIE